MIGVRFPKDRDTERRDDKADVLRRAESSRPERNIVLQSHKHKLKTMRLSIFRHQGWKNRFMIDNRYYIPCFSVIDYCRCFALNFFYRLSPFVCFLLTWYRLVESLNFTFVLVESAVAYIVSFL